MAEFTDRGLRETNKPSPLKFTSAVFQTPVTGGKLSSLLTLQLHAFFVRVFVFVCECVCAVRQCLRRLLAARVNDRSLYRDLIAARNPARILLLSAASEQPAIKTRNSPSPLQKKKHTSAFLSSLVQLPVLPRS